MAFVFAVAAVPGILAILIFGWACLHLIRGLVQGDYARGRR
jgi:hypothetical protein